MRITVVLFLIFGRCLLLELDECSGQICPTDHYTVTWSNNRFKDCLKCDKCHPGFGLYPKCGSSVTYPVKGIGCVPCVNGKTFSNDYNSAPCISCHGCVKHEIVAASCTRSSDTKCNGTCIQGYYYTKKPRHDCLRCSYCCFDGKDEIQQECVNQGLNTVKQHCIHRMDKTCGPNPTATSSSGPKLLADVDINTRDKIASLLENKKKILGGYREVAAKYGMEDHKIGSLSNSMEPGKDVIEFLMGSKPNLTVYDFCKFLKEDEMRRLDVVKILEDHFLVREGSEYV